MADVLGLYAPGTAPRRNRIPCPIHGGDGYNFSYTDSVYHCFKCGASGDVIGFVMTLFNLPFKAALDKLNSDFNLGTPTRRKPTLREQRNIQRASRQHEHKRRDREISNMAKQVESDIDRTLEYAWVHYSRMKEQYKPNRTDSDWHPLFAEAVRAIEILERAMDI